MNLAPEADPTKQERNHRPLCAKALAVEFGVSLDYIYAMRRAGAPFWGRVSTVAALMAWWSENPAFSRRAARKAKPAAPPPPKAPARNGVIFVL